MPPGKDAQGAFGLAHAQQLHGGGERRPGAGAGGHAVKEQHLPRGALGVGGGHGQYGVHDIRVVVLRHKARPDARNAVLADEPARDGGTLGRLHGDDAHHAVPCLDVLGHAGDRAAAAHADDDGVYGIPCVFINLRPRHAAVVLGVVVVGKIVGVISAVALGGVLGHALHGAAPAAAAGDDMRTQVLQPLALGNGQVAGDDQDAGVPRCGTADGQRRAETAGAGLHHRHAGLQRAALGGKGKHRLGQAVLGGTRRAAEIEIREDAGTQPVLRGIAVQHSCYLRTSVTGYHNQYKTENTRKNEIEDRSRRNN